MFSKIPTPPSSSVNFGPFEIRFYALCIITGLFISLALTNQRAKKEKSVWKLSDLIDLVIIAFPFAIVGARVYYVATMFHLYQSNPFKIFAIWEGGLGILGGLIFGVFAAFIVAKFKQKPISELLFLAVPTIPVAQAVGRLGNWFNAELYGSVTDLPWGLDITRGKYEAAEFYHPTFLYEIIWNLVIAIFLLFLSRKTIVQVFHFESAILPIYLSLYAFGRFFVELLRQDSSQYFLGIRINLFCIFAVFLSSVLTLLYLRVSKKTKKF